MNKLFVAKKPINLSSNAFLTQLKKKYKVKKAGYSGTLDPFAKGVLIIAFGKFSKLFRFLDKNKKIYKATIWLGLKSKSLDTHNIEKLNLLKPFDLHFLEDIKNSLLGELNFIPPKFSAKKINGIRAYELAKRDLKIELKTCKMQVFSCDIVSYNHPFLNIKIILSEGGYVRSWCELFAKKLGINASLSSLERIAEGNFIYENEKSLNALKTLNLRPNFIDNLDKLKFGAKLNKDELKVQENGIYYIENKENFSIIELKDEKVSYLLNNIPKE
ncbi:tRNA pseudouridine(55) synthase TruB [Campylobacter sp. LR291e]|uniref:tRNA pseudouridine(55) synthase TruB n=1 Tax=Campylobacter sp. LR291e TaxID=2593546 RepID=UPI00123AE049|nr:tRNA pseudouridine(55) synthase TruB [Campylobacter sp. LR291e]KAA6230702.1 tRNA pseudouridine(55) synthase TruB [Campylobacter sp. LR291e]